MKNRFFWIAIGLVFFVGLTRSAWITAPFIRENEVAFQPLLAINHLRYGFTENSFLSVINHTNGTPIYHVSHPPLMPILLAFAYMVFGIHEVTARSLSILMSILAGVGLLLLARRIWDCWTAFITTALYAVVPIAMIYGQFVNFEPYALAAVIWTFYLFLRWEDERRWIDVFLLWALVIVGTLIDWPYVLFIPVLYAYSLSRKRGEAIPYIALILAGSVSLAYIVWAQYVSGTEQIMSHGINRSGIGYESYLSALLNWNLWDIQLQRCKFYFTAALFYAAFISFGWGVYCIAKRKGKVTRAEWVIGAFIIHGLIYIVLFPQAAHIHPYCLYYLVPAFCLLAAYGIRQLPSNAQIVLFLILTTVCVARGSFFHALHFSDQYHLGKAIRAGVNQPDNYRLFTDRVDPLAYYAEMPVQYMYMDNLCEPPKYISLFKPDYVMLYLNVNDQVEIESGREIGEEMFGVLNQYGYQKFYHDENYQLYYRSDQNNNRLLPHLREAAAGQLPGADVLVRHNGYGYQFALKIDSPTQPVQLPVSINSLIAGAQLSFTYALDSSVQSEDAITFQIRLQERNGAEWIPFRQTIDPSKEIQGRPWRQETIDLSSHTGKDIVFYFEIIPDSPNGSKASVYWGDPRLVSELVIKF